jgi:hypothetical protein
MVLFCMVRHKFTIFLCCLGFLAYSQNRKVILLNADRTPLIGASIFNGQIPVSGRLTDSSGSVLLDGKMQQLYSIYFQQRVQSFYYPYHDTVIQQNNTSDTIEIEYFRDTVVFHNLVLHFLDKQFILDVKTIVTAPHAGLQKQSFGSNSAEDLLNRTPGVTVIGRQVSIRGGSGYSLGAASRTLLLVDEMPLLQPYSSDIRWNLLPLENLEFSSQWMPVSGSIPSGSINGLISAYSDTNTTKDLGKYYRKPNSFRFIQQVYGNPPPGVLRTWPHRNPVVSGFDFRNVVFQKKGLRLITYGQLFRDEGYRESDFSYRYRAGFNAQYQRKIAREDFVFTLRGFGLRDSTALFFFWESDSTAYKVPATAVKSTVIKTGYIDPEVEWISANHRNRIHQRNRFFYAGNTQRYNEIIFKHLAANPFGSHWSPASIVMGAFSLYTHADSLWSKTQGAYCDAQTDIELNSKNRVFFQGSVRFEQFVNQRNKPVSTPVFRGSITWNYGNKKDPWVVRAAGGQSWRAPSLIETDITTVGGNFGLFPNPFLRPESALGYDLKIKSPFNGGRYFSVSQFVCSYQNLIDLTYGIFIPAHLDTSKPHSLSEFVGARNENIYHARISGFELVGTFNQNFGSTTVRFFADYTYINPLNLNQKNDSVLRYLKYRMQHIAHVNIQVFATNGFSFLVSSRYTSFMKHIDTELEQYVPGIKEMRLAHRNGDFWTDIQLGYQPKKKRSVEQGVGWEYSFFIKNAFNVAYMGIPGNLSQPRTWGVQARFFW